MTLRKQIEVGARYGRLTYVCDIEPVTPGRRRARFQCDCGKVYDCGLQNVYQGKTRSCGCWFRYTHSRAKRTHGFAGSAVTLRRSEYRIWSLMLQRCNNQKSPSYPRYGARGIQVCPAWHKFEAFYQDMGDRPPGRYLELIDRALGYRPGNCRWATRSDFTRAARAAAKAARSEVQMTQAAIVDGTQEPQKQNNSDYDVDDYTDYRWNPGNPGDPP